MQKDHLEILLEDISGKFTMVLEGHSAIRSEMQKMHDNLNEKIEHNAFLINVVNQKVDKLDAKVDKLEAKVDVIAADLSAHRADTEAHHGLYLVKEG
jgi:hypothetical protein